MKLAVADRWFVRQTLADGITHLTEPHVDPFARCNIWHVRGRDRDLLIDSGMGVRSLRTEIQDLIDRPLTAVATHSHFDHVGSLHEFADRAMHPEEIPTMEAEDPFTLPLRLDDWPAPLLGLFEESGYQLESDCLITALPHADYDPRRYAVTPTSITRPVDEGDVLDLGDRHFEIMHLPGHSPGSIGLYEAATETLFAGDAVYDGPLLDTLPDSDITRYVATMKRLRTLSVRAVHAGHEASFGQERLTELIDAYLALRDA